MSDETLKTKLFSKFPFIPLDLHLALKIILEIISMKWWTIIDIKNYNIPSIRITLNLHCQMLSRISYIHTFPYHYFYVGYPPLYNTFSVCLSVCLSVSRAQYPWNCTSSDHKFWYTCVKWWFLQARSLFSVSKILIFCTIRLRGGGRGVLVEQKQPKMKNNNYIRHAISQEQWSIWSWFLIHLCKMMIMMIIPAFFHSFKLLIFWFISKVKEEKWPKITKNSVCGAPYVRNHTCEYYLWYTFVKWSFLQVVFSCFQNFSFPGW